MDISQENSEATLKSACEEGWAPPFPVNGQGLCSGHHQQKTKIILGLKWYKMQKILMKPNPVSLEIKAVISFPSRRQGQRCPFFSLEQLPT